MSLLHAGLGCGGVVPAAPLPGCSLAILWSHPVHKRPPTHPRPCSFTVEFECYGEMHSEELRPGGAHTPVTAGNRRQYVALYCDWVLQRSVEKQFAAFRRGFLRVGGEGRGAPCCCVAALPCLLQLPANAIWQTASPLPRPTCHALRLPAAPALAHLPRIAPAPLQVCSGPALTLFNPTELELLVCGLPHLDFEQLEAAAKYEGGYSRWGGHVQS